MNLFIINSLVDDIFKNEKNKNKRSINAIKQKVESIYKNKERNSLNVLDAFDDAVVILDHGPCTFRPSWSYNPALLL